MHRKLRWKTIPATLNLMLAGGNGFMKTGAGRLVLSASNSLSGTLYLDEQLNGDYDDGETRIAHPDALANIDAIHIRNTSTTSAGYGTELQLEGSAGNITITQPLYVTCRGNDDPTIRNISGENTISGDIDLEAGGDRFNICSDAGTLELSGKNQYVGALTAGRIYAFSGAGNHLVSGTILDSENSAPISLLKSGNGTLTLAGANTYGSATTVSGGTLLVNGSLSASSAVMVNEGATLSGCGLIGGSGGHRIRRNACAGREHRNAGGRRKRDAGGGKLNNA